MLNAIINTAKTPEFKHFCAGVVAGAAGILTGQAVSDKLFNDKDKNEPKKENKPAPAPKRITMSAIEVECVEIERNKKETLEDIRRERKKLEIEHERLLLDMERTAFERQRKLNNNLKKLACEGTTDKKEEKKIERPAIAVAVPRAMRRPEPRSAHRAR